MGKVDQFERFKQGMKAPSLGAALEASEKSEPQRKVDAPAARSAAKKQVSHYLDSELIMNLTILKARTGRSVSELYEEAIQDLLHKYRNLL